MNITKGTRVRIHKPKDTSEPPGWTPRLDRYDQQIYYVHRVFAETLIKQQEPRRGEEQTVVCATLEYYTDPFPVKEEDKPHFNIEWLEVL